METVEIDPELFITCRLCLKEKGSYQITPLVLDEIRFCFDITILPFDGLSQVICKSCKAIISHFAESKRRFKENHEKLLKLKADGITTTITEEDKTAPSQNQNNETKVQQREKREERLTSDSDSCKSEGDTLISKIVPPEFVIVDRWKERFQEYYVCRYCDKHCKSMELILSHLHLHISLINQCCNLITKNCNVTLNRIDNVPNITGTIGNLKIVQLDPNTLVLDQNDKNYYITYLPKSPVRTSDAIEVKTGILKRDINIRLRKSSVLSSDSEDECSLNVSKRKRLKRVRFLSSSPENEDVINENVNQSEETGINTHYENCISNGAVNTTHNNSDTNESNIGNESSDLNNEANIPQNTFNNSDTNELNIDNGNCNSNDSPNDTDKDGLEEIEKIPSDPDNNILSLVLSSYNKYVKKLNSRLKPNNDALNRKVLSIGRKVMCKQGMTSTGLLKYLEQKNLSITWMPSNAKMHSWKESDMVRILTKIKSKPEVDTYECLSINNNDNKHEITPNNNSIEKLNNASNKRQILNANPVDNPKQAPKKKKDVSKFVHLDQAELSLNKKTVSETPPDTIICLNDSDEEVLPRVTSVVSLAPQSIINSCLRKMNLEEPMPPQSSTPCTITTSTTAVASSVPQDLPRIKCKPVTELMSSEALKNLAQNSAAVVDHTDFISKTDLILMPTSSVAPILLTTNGQCLNELTLPVVNPGFMILHSEALPNMSTNSPFLYFTTVLKPFNLHLLPSERQLDSTFHTLVKFKLEIKQTVKSILLCLSLLGTGNMFSIKVQSVTKEYIEVHNMTALWQWEVLKAFQDDIVIAKVLAYSKKNNVSDRIHLFLNLLKSIKKVS